MMEFRLLCANARASSCNLVSVALPASSAVARGGPSTAGVEMTAQEARTSQQSDKPLWRAGADTARCAAVEARTRDSAGEKVSMCAAAVAAEPNR